MGDVDELIALYRRGVSMQAIADRYGVSRHWVRRRLVAAGEPTRPAGRPRLPVSSADVADLYESGLSWDDIAARLGIHPRRRPQPLPGDPIPPPGCAPRPLAPAPPRRPRPPAHRRRHRHRG